ncbi:MAG: hypothetical protein AMXMBFR45_24190 [Gammaproteobacteria bacterium]|nr:MAG: hypothetical protein BroJett010_02400 [Gammaproteobacteria bacterium]
MLFLTEPLQAGGDIIKLLDNLCVALLEAVLIRSAMRAGPTSRACRANRECHSPV